MWLVVGLGNPGPKYRYTRHNAGFMVIDEIAERERVPAFRSRLGGESATCTLAGQSILLLKPMEFMNRSGYAVQRTASFYKVPLDKTVVIHDELDLDLGRLRVKSGGGHGGNNGVRSIVEQTGSKDFMRIRCGIGKPQHRQQSGASWVLSDFSADEEPLVRDMVSRAADCVRVLVSEGTRAAMNQFNGIPENLRSANQTKTDREPS